MTKWQYIAATCITVGLVGCSADEKVVFPTDPGRYIAMADQEGESTLLVRQVFSDGEIFEDSGKFVRLGVGTQTVELDTCGGALIEHKSGFEDRRIMLKSLRHKKECLLSGDGLYTVVK